MTLRRRTPHRRAARQCTVADLHADAGASMAIKRRKQLRSMVQKARPRVRLTRHRRQQPLRELGPPPGHQAHMRDSRLATQARQIAGHERHRPALHDAGHRHHVAAGRLDRRRAPLTRPAAQDLNPIQLAPHMSIITTAADSEPHTTPHIDHPRR